MGVVWYRVLEFKWGKEDICMGKRVVVEMENC